MRGKYEIRLSMDPAFRARDVGGAYCVPLGRCMCRSVVFIQHNSDFPLYGEAVMDKVDGRHNHHISLKFAPFIVYTERSV